MKCCVESNQTTSAGSQQSHSTTMKPTTLRLKSTTTIKPATRPTQKLEKPTKMDTNNRVEG